MARTEHATNFHRGARSTHPDIRFKLKAADGFCGVVIRATSGLVFA